MKAVTVTAAQKELANLIAALDEGPVLLLRRGQPCAALVGLEEHFDREAFALGRNKRLRQLIDKACRKTREKGGTPFSQVVSEVEAGATQNKARPHRRRRN